MDVRRIALIAGLAIVSYIMILQWSNDYSQTNPVNTADAVIAGDLNSDNAVASEVPTGNPDVANDTQAGQAPATSQVNGDVISVRTDTLDVRISLDGGDVIYTALPEYPYSLETPNIPFRMFENNTTRTYIAQSGLVGEDGIDRQSRARFSAEQSTYELGDADQLEVVLTHEADNGLVVNKVYTFNRGAYVMDVRFDLTNQGSDTLRTNLFGQLRRDRSQDPSAGSGIGMRSYLGATFSTEDSAYEKVKFGELDDGRFNGSKVGGWVAMLQHYFLSAWIPSANDNNAFYGQKGSTGDYYVGFQAPTVVVGPGESVSTGAQLYVGPKDQDQLDELADNLEKTVDYGWLWWIAQPLFWLMQFIHGLIGNWGWSIVLMTLTVKMVLYPLTASSYRSMGKMRKFAPVISELREQYGDDRQKMSQEMMKLYQKEKLNPLGGCLPMLVQMPVFIALYWVLMESVELRQSPFIFWIQDLSLKDPFFVLPLLMGASMFLQMRMQQQPTMDPMQQKIMQFMPVMFTFMFLWFPAGLTLYWFTNNVITIVQQYIVNKNIERDEAKAKAKT
ncbi:membrane protein insertase YidC [Reinekea blandensis]|uniref:Membrane protein insertase YidC n=1 Tax=Reinekea blandensis MED297 TaxID=314283 RepID=A4BD89_9GAMM|nr:membrane protein insertase YidC [Reinekea blandensis]EAR09833.1 putative inner membrane protein translocase component YidC [Reinekea sp. MED297] [Reinekea blandensis MED297]